MKANDSGRAGRGPPDRGKNSCRMPSRASGQVDRGGYGMAAGRGNGRGKEATVARVKAGTWVGIAVGLALAPAGAGAAPYEAAVITALGTAPVAQTPMRSSRAHMALNSAIEYQRRGDYEQAAVFFAQAQANQADLTPKECEDLASGLQLNGTALEQRAAG